MREETKSWWKKAQDDLETAEILVNERKFSEAAFFLQQSVEKALKSLLIEKEGDFPKSHDLVFLGKQVGTPDNLLEYCKRIPLLIHTLGIRVSSKVPELRIKLINLLIILKRCWNG